VGALENCLQDNAEYCESWREQSDHLGNYGSMPASGRGMVRLDRE
jgi:hypothetical protein